MQLFTVVVIVCHVVAGAPLCHEEIASRGETKAACQSQPALAAWKGNSRFADDEWWIKGVRCLEPSYEKRDAT